MNEKQIEIIHTLMSQQSPLTAKYLAQNLLLSIRSIKNHIYGLNEQYNGLIISSNRGYEINQEMAKQVLHQGENFIPQNSFERSIYILKKFIFEHASQIDLYELCDELYISYSTLKLDLSKMNASFPNLNFICKNDNLSLLGEEKAIRRYASSILYEETNSGFIDLSILKRSFSVSDIEELQHILQSLIAQFSYYMSDFSFMNLVLHIIILINRVRGGYRITEKKEIPINLEERELMDALHRKIESTFHLHLEKNELFEIMMLFRANTNLILENHYNDLKTLVDESVIELGIEVLKTTSEIYRVDLLNDKFLVPFILHLNTLIIRLENDSSIRNPMLEVIKHECPLVYDVSTYMSLQLQNKLSYNINEDETAFLALHIGTEMARQKESKHKVSCVLFCPNYRDLAKTLYLNLLSVFDNQLEFVALINNREDLDYYHFDVLFTTIPLHPSLKYKCIVISPFICEENYKKIHRSIEEILDHRKNLMLREEFHNFFHEELFYLEPEFDDKDMLIHEVCLKLRKLNYVSDNYEAYVIEREKASSTAFKNIAIPHSVHMDANITCVSVILSKKGIKWDTHRVNIIFLICISTLQRDDFRELYESLIALFTNPDTVDLIKECHSFMEFENKIKALIPE